MLVTAHDALLDRVVSFLRTAKLMHRSPGDAVVIGLSLRIFQLAHALQSMCESGYASEAAPIARTILSGTASLVAICEDPDGRGHAFAKSAELPAGRRVAIADALDLTGAEREEFLLKATEYGESASTAFVKAGIKPKPVGTWRDDTWHGTSDRDLFTKMGMAKWYELFYRMASDESHVTARAITTELTELLTRDITFGSKYAQTWNVLLPSGRCITEALAQLNIVFGWDRRDEILALSEPFEDALRQYGHTAI